MHLFLHDYKQLIQKIAFCFTAALLGSAQYAHAQCCSNGPNLLQNYNPDFSAPIPSPGVPPGFRNDNTYIPGFNSTGGGVFVITNARGYQACSGANTQYDHTTGNSTGRYLWFDTPGWASATTPAVAWKPWDATKPAGTEDLISVQPHTEYIFGVWVRDLARMSNCVSGGAPIMGLRINGVDMAQVNLQNSPTCCPPWVYLCTKWNSGDSVTARIKVESRTASGFTDLGIDDVYFGKPAPIAINLGNDTTICTGGTVTLNAPAGTPSMKNKWSDSSTGGTLAVTQPGKYWLRVIDTTNFCEGTDTVEIKFGHADPFSLGNDTIICPNEAITLHAPNSGPGMQNKWSDNSTGNTLVVSQPGRYWLKVTDANFCESTDTMEVTLGGPIPFSLGNDTAICQGASVTFKPNPVPDYGDYIWQDGSKGDSLTVSETGPIALTIYYGNCGSYPDNANLFVEPPAILILPDTAICFNEDSINVFVSAVTDSINYNYKWEPADYLRDNHSPANKFSAPPGYYTYVVTATSELNCVTTDSFNIRVWPAPTITIYPQDTTINYGDKVQLHTTGNIAIWSWSPAIYLDDIHAPQPYVVSPMENMTYKLSATDENGCKNTASVDINVEYNTSVWVPSAFTPNGDGKNDVFRIIALHQERLVELKIFNRWGKVLYVAVDFAKGWDGTYNGVPMELGVYYYLATVEQPDGIIKKLKGDFTLIR